MIGPCSDMKNQQMIIKKKDYRCLNFDDEVHYRDEIENVMDYHYAPGQILGFVEHDKSIFAIVLQCHFSHKISSAISTEWKIEYIDKQCKRPSVNLMDINSIVRHCLMIPQNDEMNEYHEIWEIDRWASAFCSV